MATRELIKAHINLYSILRNIEELVTLDPEMADLIRAVRLTLQFIIRRGPSGYLAFSNARCSFGRGRAPRPDIVLYFLSPAHFNRLIAGKGMPIPLKGWLKLKFLQQDFPKLAQRLEAYLRADPEKLKQSRYLEINTRLSAYAVFFAAAELANLESQARLNAKRIPDGVLQVSIHGGPALYLEARGGTLTAHKGVWENPRAVLWFRDLETAHALMQGKLDVYTGLALGQMGMKGFIPMLDHFNPILGLVSEYLS